MVNLSTLSKLLDSYTDGVKLSPVMRILSCYQEYRQQLTSIVDGYVSNYATLQTFANDGSETTDSERQDNAKLPVSTAIMRFANQFASVKDVSKCLLDIYPNTLMAVTDSDGTPVMFFKFDDKLNLVETPGFQNNEYAAAVGMFPIYNARRINSAQNLSAITASRPYTHVSLNILFDTPFDQVSLSLWGSGTTLHVNLFRSTPAGVGMFGKNFTLDDVSTSSYVKVVREVISNYNQHKFDLLNGTSDVDSWSYSTMSKQYRYGFDLWSFVNSQNTASFYLPATRKEVDIMKTHDAMAAGAVQAGLENAASMI